MKKSGGNLMRGMRGLLGLTQGDLAKISGLSVVRISRLECGLMRVRDSERAAIAEALGITAKALESGFKRSAGGE